mgnify:FL=1
MCLALSDPLEKTHERPKAVIIEALANNFLDTGLEETYLLAI